LRESCARVGDESPKKDWPGSRPQSARITTATAASRIPPPSRERPRVTISVSAEGSHYFHDLSKYRVDTFGIINLRLYKGFSVFVLGGYSWIHDQLSLLGREPTFEEILLRLRELPMNSNHFVAVGFQFTFGSIFTNVINPRFGSSGGGGMSIHIN